VPVSIQPGCELLFQTGSFPVAGDLSRAVEQVEINSTFFVALVFPELMKPFSEL